MPFARPLATLSFAALVAASASAQITDFTTWTQIQDPASTPPGLSPFLTAAATPTQAPLAATDGPIPAADDLGFASVNANTVAASTQGFAFSTANDFSLAIDYALAITQPVSGGIGIGFGIGEDTKGVNSAGVALAYGTGTATNFLGTTNATAAVVGAAARNNNTDTGITEFTIDLAPAALIEGRFFVAYDATTGDITAGSSPTPGALAPTDTTTFAAADLNLWTGADLLASVFIRSDAINETIPVLGIPTAVSVLPFQDGAVTATFSNFEVLAGSAFAIPEPATLTLLAAAAGFALTRRRA